mmetsp:Transcript_9258/g.18228  ORF Transcript_9258/g.18228 Transcript_9258/m.18228 type:complete len:204 (-) Transcript_9258:1450-2061(-)
MVSTMPTILTKTPALAISAKVILPVAKAMAEGGVAVGSTYAREAATVAGRPRRSGLISCCTASSRRIGPKRVIAAVLLMSSVIILTMMVTMVTSTTGERSAMLTMREEISEDSPLVETALAIAKPAPMRRMTPHGRRLNAPSLRSIWPGLEEDGRKKRAMPPKTAIVPSSTKPCQVYPSTASHAASVVSEVSLGQRPRNGSMA